MSDIPQYDQNGKQAQNTKVIVILPNIVKLSFDIISDINSHMTSDIDHQRVAEFIDIWYDSLVSQSLVYQVVVVSDQGGHKTCPKPIERSSNRKHDCCKVNERAEKENG